MQLIVADLPNLPDASIAGIAYPRVLIHRQLPNYAVFYASDNSLPVCVISVGTHDEQ